VSTGAIGMATMRSRRLPRTRRSVCYEWDRRLGLARRDAYADLAIVWVLTVVRRCGLRLGRRYRVGEGEQIRSQVRSVSYDSRVQRVTGSMEH
jgi:hypothetical protein